MPVFLPKRPTVQDIHDIYKNQQAKVQEVVEVFLERIADNDNLYKSVLRTTPNLAQNLSQKLDQILDEHRPNQNVNLAETHINNSLNKNLDFSNILWFEELLKEYPLFGIPFVIKDNILVKGEKATSGSKILENYVAPYSSDVYSRLEKSGAVLIGQSNMDEFAFGSSTEKSAFQTTQNPFDLERVPGGTSGGSAAAVAAGFTVFALGTDTGGSIRQPSSFCDVVGLRPSYGLVSRCGVMASTSSFDQVGPISNSVIDNALVLSVLQGQSESDQTSLDCNQTYLNSFLQHPEFGTKLNKFRLFQVFFNLLEAFGNSHGVDTHNEYLAKANGYIANTFEYRPKIGLPKEYFAKGLSPETRERLEKIIEDLKPTFEIQEVSLPYLKYALSVYYIIQFVESTANLERYDGIRFGAQIEDLDPKDMFFKTRNEFLGEEVKRRIMLGTYTSSAGYYDAFYNKACQVKELIKKDYQSALEQTDVLLMPTSPFPAFKIGSKSDDPMSMYLADVMTITQPPAKLPGLVIPAGLVEYEGSSLPVGVQLVSMELREDLLYRVGKVIEDMVQDKEGNY